jgi:hypothetical protein
VSTCKIYLAFNAFGEHLGSLALTAQALSEITVEVFD